MHFGLGIDAGGTYTDAVLIRGSDGAIVDSKKAFTTYPDLQVGIKNVLYSLDQEILKSVNLVSVSTTLSTNSLLEGTGTNVGLIIVGEKPAQTEFPTQYMMCVEGGHDTRGDEACELDICSVEDFIETTRSKVSAYAVSAYFGVRNPEHELKVKEFIMEKTGMPVVCGHELSQELGAYERAVTAVLNAQLIPITYQFVNSVVKDIRGRGIEARLLMLKCDGSVYNLEDALERPIETIFSGPAASLLGASYLSKMETCAVIDIGGTSTDVSMLYNGVPEISSSGATVGGWKTRVRAMKMETSATGGDSHIWVTESKVHVGPRRVIPLCVASKMYPDLSNKLKRSKVISRNLMDENYQPTKFFVRSDYEASDLDKDEKEVLSFMGSDPVSAVELSGMLNRTVATNVFDSLVQKRLIQGIGFTPTDALHVLGVYTKWDVDASETGAMNLARYVTKGKYDLCTHVRELVAKNMAADLMSYILPHHPSGMIADLLSHEYPAKFKVELPVVLLGGPSQAYGSELRSLIEADVVVPEFADVGNAVGALAGKGVKRIEIMIMPASIENPDEDFLVFSPVGRERFQRYGDAVEFATGLGKELVLDYESRCGILEQDTKISVSKKTTSPDNWSHPPLETRVTIVGVGNPMMILKD
ncbi:hydantoinase/oxoprolinase family protein [Methanolobus profundi]|uniref:N-methylhydantoinase A/oxoprolinase/acetone carboxylase, beta subunit n=1 Tax=Methanolobus profundi TaxID=487685 RepID=A0A1I4PIS9_9EURY|nr:hydantoinase/oxoprolinase family protein [Methanolobus profundi]SFM27741.1 N-methylhydantoinase A/oxoprolinase/acetone carboxylase, beta subunit [Methanolobus profundi]